MNTSYSWNMMGSTESGNDISAVIIDTHGNENVLGFGKKVEDKLYSNEILNLEKKDIDNLILLGCNAGHLDYSDTNPAAAFSQIVNGGRVLASDGTVGSSRSWIFWGEYNYLPLDDKIFKKICTTERFAGDDVVLHEGWIIYQYIDNKVKTSDSIGYALTIKQMLKKMH